MRPWAYEAHKAHEAISAMSMLDCPDDFQRENGSFSVLKKKRFTSIRPSDTTSYRNAKTRLEKRQSQPVIRGGHSRCLDSGMASFSFQLPVQ